MDCSSSLKLRGDARHGLWATGSLYDAHYLRQSSFDLLIARLGPAYRFPAGSWRIKAGLYGTYVRLGSNELESIGSLLLSAGHRLGSADLRLDCALERVGGGGSYDYLTGYQSTFALRATWQLPNVEVEAGPAMTVSRRRDLIAGGEFFSVSATRLQLDVYALWSAGERVRVYARGSYSRSRYRDPNIYFDQGALNTRRRIDGTSEAEIGLLYDITPDWHIGLEYSLRRNDSSIGSYAYSSNRYLLRLQRTY